MSCGGGVISFRNLAIKFNHCLFSTGYIKNLFNYSKQKVYLTFNKYNYFFINLQIIWLLNYELFFVNPLIYLVY